MPAWQLACTGSDAHHVSEEREFPLSLQPSGGALQQCTGGRRHCGVCAPKSLAGGHTIELSSPSLRCRPPALDELGGDAGSAGSGPCQVH